MHGLHMILGVGLHSQVRGMVRAHPVAGLPREGLVSSIRLLQATSRLHLTCITWR